MAELPPGFELETDGELPPLPPGFELEGQPVASRKIGVGEDIVTNALPGAAFHTATGLATIPGNADEMARIVGHWLAEKIAGKTLDMPERPLGGVLPSQAQLEERLPVKSREAKTGIGRAVETAGEIAGNALVMPAQGAKQLVGNAIKYGAIPYGAGQAARTGVGMIPGASESDKDVAGLVAATGAAGVAARGKGPVTGARATEDIKASAGSILDEAKSLDVKITQPAVNRIVQAMDDLASDERIKPYIEKSTSQLLEEFRAQRTGDVGWADLMKDRSVFRKIERDDITQHQGKSTSDGMMAGRMVDVIDRELGNVGHGEIIGTGSPDTIRRLYKEGNRDWKMYRDAEAIDDAFYSADISAKAARGDYDGAVRDAFRKLARKGQIERFGPDAREAILQVVQADKVERAQRFLAKFSPEQRPLMSVVGAAAIGGPLGMAVPVAGMAGNAMAGARTLRQADEASAVVRGGRREPNIAIRRIPALIPGLGNMATQGPR